MRKYRIWISLGVIEQPFTSSVSKKNESQFFSSDAEVKAWVEKWIKSNIRGVKFFVRGSYAILKEDGEYIRGII